MEDIVRQSLRRGSALLCSLALLAFTAVPALAGEYAALTGVKGLDSVFDVSVSSAAKAVVTFPAIRGVYLDQEVRGLPAAPRTVIVFHGGAVKLVSTETTGVDKADQESLDKVVAMIRQFKKDGVKLEVCMYAVKALDIDPATILPEVDKVGNGFISVLGYQAQGYSLVSIP